MTPVIVALDVPSARAALALVDDLGPGADFYKVGLELFSREGPGVVRALRERGKRVFLDLKLHDIPNTVARAVESAAESGAELLTLHASGGRTMMEAAAEVARSRGGIRLLGVTVLTSLPVAEVEAVWGRDLHSLRDEVVRLGRLVVDAGLDGVVASAREAEALKRNLGPQVLVVTPGIRLRGDELHDQNRVATPGEAVRAGADLLVVGRSVTAAPDPRSALERLLLEVSDASEATRP